ncbi:minor capsid protein [Bacillus thuringiensis]|uniref:Minor capsid protein n=1 Tax=Bacillus thuringiensis serovar andalousiensis TaxID=257985 RepID=A0A6H0TLL7_BACTU|nr:minor capsid protein [Bacillus thuringiensis]QIW21329.1 minor capsid protein [Bacillus thuringiensis serovar andalousiensis]
MIKVNIKVDTAAIEQKVLSANKKAQFALDQQVLKDSNFYAPEDTGELIRSGVRFSQPGEGHVEWSTPYSRRLYWNPQYSFSKDTNPNAQGLWFEAAKSAKLDDWVRIVEQKMKENL